MSALGCILSAQHISAGFAGLVLSYCLGSSFSINFLVVSLSEVESEMVAVERIKEYSHVAQERVALHTMIPGYYSLLDCRTLRLCRTIIVMADLESVKPAALLIMRAVQ